MSVAFGVHRWLQDGVRQSDCGFQVCGRGTPQRLEPWEPGTGEMQLFQAIDRDDWKRKHTFVMMLLLFLNQFQETKSGGFCFTFFNVSFDGSKKLDKYSLPLNRFILLPDSLV